jgi:hypothetical protein
LSDEPEKTEEVENNEEIESNEDTEGVDKEDEEQPETLI